MTTTPETIPTPSSGTALQVLPPELWLRVADYLPPSSIGSLALTNSHMLSLMPRKQVFQLLHHYVGPIRQERMKYFQFLEEFYPKHAICPICGYFHRYSAWPSSPLEPSKLRGKAKKAKNRDTMTFIRFECPAWKKYINDARVDMGDHCVFNFWALHAWLSFHLIMRAHRLGSEYGIPVSAIQQQEPIRIHSASGRGTPWKRDFCAVIDETGRLLARERMIRMIEKGEWMTGYDFCTIGWHLLEMCRHEKNRDKTNECSFFRQLKWTLDDLEREGPEKEAGVLNAKRRCCKWCLTEWELQLLPKKTYKSPSYEGVFPTTTRRDWRFSDYMLLSTRYYDVGACQTPEDLDWVNLVEGQYYRTPNVSGDLRTRFLKAVGDDATKKESWSDKVRDWIKRGMRD